MGRTGSGVPGIGARTADREARGGRVAAKGSADLFDGERSGGERAAEFGRGGRPVEPAGIVGRGQDDDLAIMIGGDVGAGRAGEHRPRLPHGRVRFPHPGDAEPVMARKREGPFGFGRLFRRFGRIGCGGGCGGGGVGELEKAIDGDQAAAASGAVGQGAAIGAEIIDGPPATPAARGRGPAPAARDHFGSQRRGGIGGDGVGSVGAGADDFQPVGDADRIEGREIGHAFGKVERDAGFAEVADQLCNLGAAIGFVAHGGEGSGVRQAIEGKRGMLN